MIVNGISEPRAGHFAQTVSVLSQRCQVSVSGIVPGIGNYLVLVSVYCTGIRNGQFTDFKCISISSELIPNLSKNDFDKSPIDFIDFWLPSL